MFVCMCIMTQRKPELKNDIEDIDEHFHVQCASNTDTALTLAVF